MVNRFKIKKTVRRGKVLCLLVIKHIKEDGFVITFEKIVNALASKKQISYRKWMEKPLYTEKELEEQRHETFSKKIKISVITPLYNTPETFLKEMIDSVIGHICSHLFRIQQVFRHKVCISICKTFYTQIADTAISA